MRKHTAELAKLPPETLRDLSRKIRRDNRWYAIGGIAAGAICGGAIFALVTTPAAALAFALGALTALGAIVALVESR